MPVTHADVEMLQNSMRGLGGAFRQGRLDSEARKQHDIENSLRERSLKASEQRASAQDAGEVEAYLTGDDGGVVQYKGQPKGLQTVLDEAAKKGKPLTVSKAPTKAPNIGSFTTQTPLGQFTFHLNNTEDVDKVSALAKQIGGQKAGGEFKTAPIANAQHLKQLQAAVAAAQTPAEKTAAQQDLDTFTELVQRSRPEDTETVTDVYKGKDEVPEVPESTSGFGPWKKTIPGTPAIPAQPERRVTRKVPVGTGAPQAPMPQVGASAPAVAAFASEAAARAAGKKAGDVVRLVGIGNVQLQ